MRGVGPAAESPRMARRLVCCDGVGVDLTGEPGVWARTGDASMLGYLRRFAAATSNFHIRNSICSVT